MPLLVGSVGAHAFTVLPLKRSILTEKVARRGYHLSREYAVDPLEILFVREVKRTKVVALAATNTLAEMQQSLRSDHRQTQRLLPVVDLLKARTRHLEEERRRERTLQLRFLLPGGKVSKETDLPAAR